MADLLTSIERWASRRHLGRAKPSQTVLVRRGKFVHHRWPWEGQDVHATIPGGRDPWRKVWTPTSAWLEVPGVLDVEIDQSFDNDGIANANLTIENVRMAPRGDGTFHRFQRGFLTGWRGYRKPDQPKNEWTKKFGKKAEIAILQGYGHDQETPSFVGLINDADFSSRPDRVTAVARDFGQVLTDQRMYGYNVERSLHQPITFMDRRQGQINRKVGNKARASSSQDGYPPRRVFDKSGDTEWKSVGREDPDRTEWCEIHVPRGRYHRIFLDPRYKNMTCYISVYARDRVHTRSQVDDSPVDEGWVDLFDGDRMVPGDENHGEIPYVKKVHVDGDAKYWSLGHKFELGKDSKIRLSFRNLHPSHTVEQPRHRCYRAGIRRFYAEWRKQKPTVKKNKIILVDDLSDIVKVVLRWAGFTEWEVENTGVRLKKPVRFNMANSLMDPIKKIAEQTNYVFYIKPPTTLGNDSIGIPVFRNNRILDRRRDEREDAPTIRDDQLLTALSVKESDEVMPSVIRIFGKRATKEHGGRHIPDMRKAGRRYLAKYFPRWHRTRETAGMVRHLHHLEPRLESNLECKIMAILTALACALRIKTGSFEIPAMPWFTLDQKVAVWDDGTATHARIYIAQKTSTFHTGADAAWTMTLGGAMLDTPEVDGCLRDLAYNLRRAREEKKFNANSPFDVTGAGDALRDVTFGEPHVTDRNRHRSG